MLENTEHSAFPVLNNFGRPVGLIERDSLIAMIQNKCWYFRESRVSGNFGKREEIPIKNLTLTEQEATIYLGGVRIEEKRAETEQPDRAGLMTHAGSINREDEIKGFLIPKKKSDQFEFENGGSQMQNELLHSILKENSKPYGNHEESDHEDYR